MTLVLLLKKLVRRCARKGGRVLHLGLLNEAAFCLPPHGGEQTDRQRYADGAWAQVHEEMLRPGVAAVFW